MCEDFAYTEITLKSSSFLLVSVANLCELECEVEICMEKSCMWTPIEINGFHLQNFAELEYFWPDCR